MYASAGRPVLLSCRRPCHTEGYIILFYPIKCKAGLKWNTGYLLWYGRTIRITTHTHSSNLNTRTREKLFIFLVLGLALLGATSILSEVRQINTRCMNIYTRVLINFT
jgi:hypothetical protein